jgi:type I restriction enzyme R subunit
VKSADVTEIMMQLQSIVSDSVVIKEALEEEKEGVYVDLSTLDFAKLRAAFEKAPRKNTLTYDLQQAIDKKLQQMLKENPLRLEFYERYREIIDEYNAGKSLENTVKAFENLTEFIKNLTIEEKRAVSENLGDQETLAIFDLLREGKELEGKELKQVKKVAKETLEKLKAEKLKIEHWREKREITAQVKLMIYNQLLWLPEEAYNDEEVSMKSLSVYQHIYSNYYGGGKSVYQQSA